MDQSHSRPPEEPISQQAAEYAQELVDIGNIPLWTADQYLEAFSGLLEFKFSSLEGIESLPGDHSWIELSRAVISSVIGPDLANVEMMSLAYSILLEPGPGNVFITEALKILLLWQ